MKFIITRHGFSCNNIKKHSQFLEKDNDPSLSVWGYIQTLIKSKQTPEFYTSKVVFVSCLIRTWETAILLYLPNLTEKTITLIISPYLKEKHMIDKIDVGNWPMHLTDQIHKFLLFLQYYTYITNNMKQLEHDQIGDVMLNKLQKSLKKLIKICIGDINITIDLSRINDVEYLKNFGKFENPYGDKLIVREKKTLFLNNAEIPNRIEYFNYVSKLIKNSEHEMFQIVDIIPLPDSPVTLTEVKSNDYTFYKKGKNIQYFISWASKNSTIFDVKNIHCVSHSNTMKEFVATIDEKLLPKDMSEQNNWDLVFDLEDGIMKNMKMYSGRLKPKKQRNYDNLKGFYNAILGEMAVTSACEELCDFRHGFNEKRLSGRSRQCKKNMKDKFNRFLSKKSQLNLLT